MDRKRYPKNWEQIAFKIKEKAKWKCTKCGLQCLKPTDNKNDKSIKHLITTKIVKAVSSAVVVSCMNIVNFNINNQPSQVIQGSFHQSDV